jgi:hypothetical protein
MLWFNGLDGRRGTYLLPPVPPRQLADFACGATIIGDPAVRVAVPPSKEVHCEN